LKNVKSLSGSVTDVNAEELIKKVNIDGFLVKNQRVVKY